MCKAWCREMLLRTGGLCSAQPCTIGDILFAGSGPEILHSITCWQRSLCRATSLFYIIWKLWTVTEWRKNRGRSTMFTQKMHRNMCKIAFDHGCSSAYWRCACMMWTSSVLTHTSFTQRQEHLLKAAPVNQNKIFVFLLSMEHHRQHVPLWTWQLAQ